MASKKIIFGEGIKQVVRKKRSDAKHDIKVLVTIEDKKQLQHMAKNNGKVLTEFASEIVGKQLENLDQDFVNYDYEDGDFIHVLLNGEHFKMIQNLSIEWGLSIRKTAYKLLKNHIASISGGFIIHDYRRERR